MRHLFLALVAAVALLPAQPARTFTGTITDSECPSADHSLMKMGETNADCTIACIDAHGATYVLFDGRTSYNLTDQRTPEKFAGKRVTITGTLDSGTKTITVQSIVAAGP